MYAFLLMVSVVSTAVGVFAIGFGIPNHEFGLGNTLIVSGAVARPISAGVAVLLYVDLRMRREGLDLVLQTAAASGGAPTGDEFASLWRPGAQAAPMGQGAAPPAPPPPPAW